MATFKLNMSRFLFAALLLVVVVIIVVIALVVVVVVVAVLLCLLVARLASNYGRRSVALSTLHGAVIKNVIKVTIFNGACEKLNVFHIWFH